MLGAVANINHPACFKMAVADVEIAVIAIDRDAASAELTTVERVVVVIELQKGYASLAILKQAVFEGGFGERLALVGMIFQDGSIGKAPERQVPVSDLCLKTLGRLVMESHASLASPIQFETDES